MPTMGGPTVQTVTSNRVLPSAEREAAYRLRAAERGIWAETGWDTSTDVVLAIRNRLVRQGSPMTAAA